MPCVVALLFYATTFIIRNAHIITVGYVGELAVPCCRKSASCRDYAEGAVHSYFQVLFCNSDLLSLKNICLDEIRQALTGATVI